VGAHRYALCPDFEVTVIAWAFDKDPVQSVVWPNTSGLPPEVMAHVVAGGEISAHNASLEHTVLAQYYTETVPFETMNCTMQRALVWGLPAGLLEAGKALRLSVLKDETERRLMLDMSKPRKGGLPPWHQVDPARLARLEAYCRQDVEAERALAAALPELSADEKKISLLDAQSNDMGVLIDINAVVALKTAALAAHTKLNSEVSALTSGAIKNIGGERDRILAWCADRGIVLPDLKKETVETELEDPTLPPDVTRLLELRQLGAKASLKKLDRMLAQAGLDNRPRGAPRYFGAGRTGRWSGQGIQVQNMPKPRDGINVEATLKVAARDGALSPLVYASPLAAISSCLRGCLVAKPGHVLVSMDLRQIEARVLAWLAGENRVLDLFRRGEDPYVVNAASVGSSDRTLGKVMTLGAGFGIGPAKFQYTAKTQYGLVLTLEEAANAVAGWRANNQRIVTFWWDMASEIKMALGAVPVIGNRSHGAPGGVRTVRRLKLRYDPGRYRP
jgi:DNA polymerase